MVELFDSLSGRPVQYLMAFRSRPEATSDVISGTFVAPIVLDKCVKFRDPCYNRYREIPLEAAGGVIFVSFFALTSDRKYIDNDVISDVRVKFDDSRSNGFRDIQ